MARYIEATKCAEIISEKLDVRLFDLVDVFAEIPTADVVPKGEVDILKSTITHKEEEAYNKGYADAKADILEELKAKIDVEIKWNEQLLQESSDGFFEGRLEAYRTAIKHLAEITQQDKGEE